MTRQEVAKLLHVIRITYPNVYRDYTPEQFDATIDAWLFTLEDFDYHDASVGLKIYMSTNNSGFAPVPGQVIDCYRKSQPNNELGEQEAWAMVRKALRNGIYGAEEEYAKLPASVQKAVGKPENLKEWAQMDTETVESVQQSLFLRSYRAEVQRAKDHDMLPASVRNLLEGAQMLEVGA